MVESANLEGLGEGTGMTLIGADAAAVQVHMEQPLCIAFSGPQHIAPNYQRANQAVRQNQDSRLSPCHGNIAHH